MIKKVSGLYEFTHADLLALSVPSQNSTSKFELRCKLNAHSQRFPRQILIPQLLKELAMAHTTGGGELLEAVMMTLPALVAFPLDGLVTCIAAEANLTARKHLPRCQ